MIDLFTLSTAKAYTDSKLDDVVNPLVVSLTLNPTVAEKGSTVNSTNLTWTCSKVVSAQTLDGTTINSSLRTYTYSTPLTSSKTFVLVDTTVGGVSKTTNATLNFYNGIYYGKSSSVTYNSALITSLTKVLSETKARTISVTSNAGEYIYYCLPSRLSSGISFSVGGFSGGFSKVATISYTNASGYSENFDIFRSDNSGLGVTSVVIS